MHFLLLALTTPKLPLGQQAQQWEKHLGRTVKGLIILPALSELCKSQYGVLVLEIGMYQPALSYAVLPDLVMFWGDCNSFLCNERLFLIVHIIFREMSS